MKNRARAMGVVVKVSKSKSPSVMRWQVEKEEAMEEKEGEVEERRMWKEREKPMRTNR